jgi:hypothetical protein
MIAVVLLGAAPDAGFAQGVTTGAITGLVTNPDNQPVANANVLITNRTTGFTTATVTRANGMFLMQGLEVGGPYSVEVTTIGFAAATRNDLYVRLSATTRADFQLSVQAVELRALDITVSRAAEFSPTRQGVSSVVTDTLLRRVPTLGRDFLNLLKLTPQVVQPLDGGPSAGGAFSRFNVFTIDGANQGEKFNLSSSGGVPGGASGSRMLSIEAVREFRVLLTPTDVRQGNFAGMLVNAVTRSGTNEFHGGGTFTYRNENFAAEPLRARELDLKQYSVQLGGPIIRDRLHFFVAPEWQERAQPADGPFYASSGPGSTEAPAVPRDSLNTIRNIMQQQYNFDVGSELPLSIETPLRNLFGRLDFAINQNHRVVFRQILNKIENTSFFRNNNSLNASPTVQNSGFRFGSNLFNGVNKNNSSVLQLYSNFASGGSNELLLGYNTIRDLRLVSVEAPEISVGVNVGGTVRAVTFGTEQFSPGNKLDQDIIEVVDNFTIPLNRHTITVGGRFEQTNIFNNFAQRSFGVYVFPTIAALRNGTPSGYSIGYDNSQTGRGIPADFSIQQYSLYGQDVWAVNDRLTVTAGLRADIPNFLDTPLANDSLAVRSRAAGLELRTDIKPSTQVLFSPRVGFNYDPTGQQINQIRGNVGIYTGPPPYILVGNAYANTGLGLVTLSCTGGTTPVPAFTLDVDNLPRACGGQQPPAPNFAGTSGINLTDPDFKYPQYLGISGGFDRRLPYGFVLTVEGLYRKAINGLLIRDVNLKGPRLVGGQPYTDRHGRVLYADTINAAGTVTNTNQLLIPRMRNANLTEGLIQVTNQSEDYNATMSAQLNRRFSESFEATVGYTYMRSKDVQSFQSDRAISNWRNGRQLSTSHDNLTPNTAWYERPHRLLAFGTYRLPWKITDVTFYYEGISGSPITFVAVGDLNGDGYNGNDPIYVPNDATDANEIRIGTGVGTAFVQNLQQAQQFDDLISSLECLDEQRGSIMKRHSCRTPFQHRLDLSLRQSIPQVRGQQVTLQLDFFNFLNFLDKDWGQIKLTSLSSTFPDQRVLVQNGRNPGPLNQSIPTFSFDNRYVNPFEGRTTGSNYQLQLTLRYAF